MSDVEQTAAEVVAEAVPEVPVYDSEGHVYGALARAEALAAGDPDWMNVTRWPK
jgi:hypothetical protein